MLDKAKLENQRANYIRIRDDAARWAELFAGGDFAPDLQELARCTQAALDALEIAIDRVAQTHG